MQNPRRTSRARAVPLVVGLALLGLAGTARAHVPYLETQDFTHERPFTPRSPLQSTAIYAWLGEPGDVDWYTFTVAEQIPFFAEVLVPVFEAYRDFRPSFALVGPGLPPVRQPLPVVVADGCGAVVMHDTSVPRETFYEPFGGKSYYRGPRVRRDLKPGTYTLVYWDPARKKGDYVAVIGEKEIWNPRDIVQALKITPVIRRGGELHLSARREDER